MTSGSRQDGGVGTADCGGGYSIDFDWGGMNDPILVIYRTPGLDMAFMLPNYSCDVRNCCGGE